MCLFHQETIRIKQRISSLEGLLAVHEQTRSKLISQVDADADFTSNQARRREAERQQVKAAIENRRDSQLKNLHAEDKLGRLRSIVSGWDLFWAVGTCVLIVDVIAYLAGIEPTNTEELGLYFMLMELPILLMILAWNLNRKLMAIKMEILQLQSMDIAMEVEGVLAENTEREDEQHRREQDQRTRALDECVQRIYDAKVELELLRKQLADLNS